MAIIPKTKMHIQLRSLLRLALAVGLLSLVAVVTINLFVTRDTPLLSVDESRLHLGKIETSREVKLAFSVNNRDSKKVSIVGSGGNACDLNGCILMIAPDLFELAPGVTKEIVIHYKSPPVPGRFEKEFIIYSATDTLNEHKLKVTGVAVKAKKNSDIQHGDTKNTEVNPGEEKSDVVAKSK